MIKKINNFWIYLSIFLLVLLFVFRNLFLNGFSESLMSWGDYPYIIWVINQNIGHFKNFDFVNIFQSNIFYPYKNTLLLSDLLLPQSIIYLIVSFLGLTQIANFNILLLITLLLNYSALFLFWKIFFKDNFLSFLGSTFFVFSPFFIEQLGHFQMMSYWPMFFSLYFLIKDKSFFKIKNVFIAGFFLAIQFLSSVYLAIFLCFVSGIWFLFSFNKKNIKNTLLSFLIYFLTFVIIDGFFIKGYFETKNIYKIVRPINEYILYSAHVTDYLFPNTSSLIYQHTLIKKWNSFNYHINGEKAVFPGFLFLALFLFGLFNFTKIKNDRSISFVLTKERIFFLLLMIMGFIFSLGPRLSVNGVYAHIPLPSYILLKFLPMFNTIRASARWSFLVYLGMIYFCLMVIKAIKNKKNLGLISLLILFFLIEYIPINLKSSKSKFALVQSSFLKENCTENDILMQIPYSHLFGVKGGIGNGLQYITKIEYNSIFYKCRLVNGYSGYDIPETIEFFQKVDQLVVNNKYNDFYNLIKSRNIKYLQLNPEYLDNSPVYENFLKIMNKEGFLIEIEKNIYSVY